MQCIDIGDAFEALTTTFTLGGLALSEASAALAAAVPVVASVGLVRARALSLVFIIIDKDGRRVLTVFNMYTSLGGTSGDMVVRVAHAALDTRTVIVPIRRVGGAELCQRRW